MMLGSPVSLASMATFLNLLDEHLPHHRDQGHVLDYIFCK